ncbi:MAG: pyridoxal-phosphate dependent enzyme, partial [Chloroflexi bacterium]|nr:pyridoxal-phosphate dependent enzyme [Chloroflexota bacterium]
SIVAKSINPKIEVIAVQSEAAPAMQLSWQSGEMVSANMNTFAEGIATRVPFVNTQHIMRHYLDDFVLVSEAAIKTAVKQYLQHTHNLAEGAGAAPLAAALQLKERLAGKKVALIMSGGNLSIEKLRQILGDGQ